MTPRAATGGPAPCSTAVNAASGAYTADQIASAYDFTGLYGAGDLGAGQTVGLYELEPNLKSDISAYQSCYQTSALVSYAKVDGGAGSGAGSGEAALDIEDVIGLAPAANLLVYQGPNTDVGALDTYQKMVTDNQAKVISTSWGACESHLAAGDAATENTLFAEAAIQGQTVVSASGDSGVRDCYEPTRKVTTPSVDDPASQPFVIGVGGTTLTSPGPPPAESVWNNSTGAGGGGDSSLWPMPAYQSAADPSLGVIDSGSAPASTCGGSTGYCRQVPDVSADADPNTGYVEYWRGDGSPDDSSAWS
ncbi:MAG: S53 family peptidase, partial [Actinomycetota bacterium]|nr:S53 family peptidase [Actinomycetota bacterium]